MNPTIDPAATLALISELYAGMGALREQLDAVTAERDALADQLRDAPGGSV